MYFTFIERAKTKNGFSARFGGNILFINAQLVRKILLLMIMRICDKLAWGLAKSNNQNIKGR